MFCQEGKLKYVPVIFDIFGFSFDNKGKNKPNSSLWPLFWEE